MTAKTTTKITPTIAQQYAAYLPEGVELSGATPEQIAAAVAEGRRMRPVALVSSDYGVTVQLMAEDPILVEMAKALAQHNDVTECFREDGSPTGDFMMAAMRAYNDRGGKIGGHIGGAAEAIFAVLKTVECGRTLRKDGRPWICELMVADHVGGHDHEAYDRKASLVTTWPWSPPKSDDQAAGTTRPVEGAKVVQMPATGIRPDSYTGPMGRDAEGYLVFRNRDGMDLRVTECCQASAKGVEDGVACRSCYKLIDEMIGGAPAAPYIDNGVVTSTKVLGWPADMLGGPGAYRVSVPPEALEAAAEKAVADGGGKVSSCDRCGYQFKRPQARRTCASQAACDRRRGA